MYSEKALAQLQENGYGAAEACFEQRSGEGEGNDVLQHPVLENLPMTRQGSLRR